MIWLALSCADPPIHVQAPETSTAAEVVWTELEAPRLYRRMHLDLTGQLPAVEDLDRLVQDPEQLDAMRDELLQDPRLEERLVALLAERWLTQVDEFMYEYEEYAELIDAGVTEYAWERSVADEPLRLMARIAVDDRPWTDIVTADTTMANELLAHEWPVDYPEGETGWREVRYADGRPAAGILATNGLWLRYTTTLTNYNRGRAAMLSSQLVCEDFFARPVDLSELDVGDDPSSLEDALHTTPHCQGCHSSLDPAAAALFGFYAADQRSQLEHEDYHAEREAEGPVVLGVEMAWFGRPVSGLQDLGIAIATDPRFDSCAVETWAGLMWRRTPDNQDLSRLDALRGDFVDGERRVRPLLSAILDSPEYRADRPPEGGDPDRDGQVHPMPPRLLADAVEGVTGFRWEHTGFDQLDNSAIGHRTLGGGVDGDFVTSPQRVPSATQVLVVQRLAEAAAGHAVDEGLVTPPADVGAWVDEQFWALTARELEASDRDALVALYTTIEARSGADEATAATLSALLQDPEFWTW